MKCFNCSAEISEGLQICPQCGANQGFTKELIDRARNNDQAAITELYNKTYSNVYYTVKALIKDEDAALDILQDSYIKAFKSLDQLKEPEKFKAWVKQIAHNRSIDYLRKTKPLLFSEIESTDSDTPLEFEDTNTDNLPEAVIDRDETSRLIREILNDLPDEQRAVISMFYYEQLSVKEIADQLGVSENTVKSRLNYGRKKIETKVLDLEKKGTKLYGLAPIPFLLLLYKTQSAQAASVAPAVSANVLSACSAKVAAVTATKASSGIIGTLKSSLAAKIVAGVLAVGIIAGSVTATVHFTRRQDVGEHTYESEQESVLSGIWNETENNENYEMIFENISGEFIDPRGLFKVTLPTVYSRCGIIHSYNGSDYSVYAVDKEIYPNSVVTFGNKFFLSADIRVYENAVYESIRKDPDSVLAEYNSFVIARNDKYTAVYHDVGYSKQDIEWIPDATRGNDKSLDYQGNEEFYLEQLHALDAVKVELLQSFEFVSGTTEKQDMLGYEVTFPHDQCTVTIPPMWYEYGGVGYVTGDDVSTITFGSYNGNKDLENELLEICIVYDPDCEIPSENTYGLIMRTADKTIYWTTEYADQYYSNYIDDASREIDRQLRGSINGILDSFKLTENK